MFGSSSSPPKKPPPEPASQSTETAQDSTQTASMPDDRTSSPAGDNATTISGNPVERKSEDSGPSTDKNGGDKRNRRISGVERAKGIFTSAKNSLIPNSPTRSPTAKDMQTPMQKLGRTDPVLGVPQGSLNNAAGESHPGPRSTFRVGVTEDKNRKCRRTMEDTHAYLYNFLVTPAPALDSDVPLQPVASNVETASNASEASTQPIVETDNGYFAIFDGHAGSFAAEWCGKKLHILLEDNIRKNPNTPIPELLDMTFTSVDQQLEKLPLKNSGCTAVVAVLRWEDRVPTTSSATGSSAIAPAVLRASTTTSMPDIPDAVGRKTTGSPEQHRLSQANARTASAAVEKELRASAMRQRVLYTANVGDARIVLCRNGKALRLSYDHKGSDEHEGKRISNAGGLVLNNRVNGVLAVTRALGDAYMKDLVTGHPYTTETVIQPDIDEFLILACDGLWDVCTDQDAVDLVRQTPDPQVASKQLVEHALARFSTDNLSCMVIRFNNRALQDAVERRVDPIGVDGDPASLKGGISETAAIVNAAKRSLTEVNSNSSQSADLETVDTQTILEGTEEQEPGPELDPEGLKKAQEKAKEGQKQAELASV